MKKEEKIMIEKKEGHKIVFWHGIGHAIQFVKGRDGAENDRKTIGFENYVRKIVGFPERAGKNHGDLPGSQGSDNNF